MAKTLFISEDKAKESSVVHENIDNKYIRSAILDIQALTIEPLLGSTLYDEISDQIDADTVSALNVTLLDDYVQPVIRAYLSAEMCMRVNFKITNKSVNSNSGDNAQAVDINTLFKIKAHWENKAQELEERAINYLKENKSSYPKYETPDSGLDVIRPKKSAHTNGMWLGDMSSTDKDIDCGCT